MAVTRPEWTKLTKSKKGTLWATATLVICGAYSIYANVRAGQAYRDSIIGSVFPPIVAFVSSHLITYFNPRKMVWKVGVYGGFGIVCISSMVGSGQHIYEFSRSIGQVWWVALMYVIMTDLPMLLAAGVLAAKVPTTAETTKQTKTDTVVQPVKTVPAKTIAAKATAPRVSRAKPKTDTVASSA